jgi:uncharacterized membrane protein
MDLKPLWLLMHVASAVVWVGGMHFAYQCLRPIAAQQLDPPLRLALWAGVFARFFPWVWLAIGLILVSGFAMILRLGFPQAPLFTHLMASSGIIMMLIFAHVYFAPFRRLRQCVADQAWKAAGEALNQIRRMVGINLVLGYVTITIATLGHYLPA